MDDAVIRISLPRLPQALRRPIWLWMQDHRPEFCEFMRSEQCLAIRDGLGALPVLELSDSEARELLRKYPILARYAT